MKFRHRLAVLLMAGAFAVQIPAVPAYARLEERLTAENGQFIRANGTAIEGAVAKGVTVSKYQNRAGDIDWSRAAADGVTFAMVRLGYHNDLDPYFDENMQGALAQGIHTGVFLYTQAMDEETARAEAQFVLERSKIIRFPIRLHMMWSPSIFWIWERRRSSLPPRSMLSAR